MNQVTKQKQANDLVNQLNSDRVNQEYLSLVKNLFLGSAAAGGAIRGSQGLVNMVRRNTAPKEKPLTPTSFALPVPTEPAAPATVPFGKFGGMFQGAWDAAMAPVKAVGDWAQGKNVSDMTQLPWFWGGAATAGAGGLYAGYKGVDSLMNSRRKAELEAEENSARQEYEKSLAGISSKQAADSDAELDSKFAKLYESKEAILKEAADLKQLGSVALGAWPPLALLSGTMAYNITNSRRRSELLAKAVKQRQRQQLADTPPFAYVPDMSTPNTNLGAQGSEPALETAVA